VEVPHTGHDAQKMLGSNVVIQVCFSLPGEGEIATRERKRERQVVERRTGTE
jgi:hypothetical protein